MKKGIAITFIVFCIFFACNRGPQAPFDPDDEVVIHGTYYNEAGDFLSEQWVGFWINSPESFFTNFLGLDPEENDRTDSVGVYSETFMGEDLMDAQGATFQVIIMNYDPNWPDTMPKVACLFFPLDTDIEVPAMTLWRGSPGVSVPDSLATFTWDTHTSEPDRYTFQVKATQDGPGYTMWQEDMGLNTTVTLPGYVLPEVYVSKWRVIAEFDAPSDSDFGYAYVTDPDTTPIPDTPYQLLSLGRNCYAEAYPNSFDKATDGKWGPWPTYCVTFPATNVSWIYVDLGDTTNTVNALVLYDLTIAGTPATAGFDVFVSNDTLNWGSAVGSTNQQNGYFYIDGFSTQGQYVKLQAKDANIGITGFREITIFGP